MIRAGVGQSNSSSTAVAAEEAVAQALAQAGSARADCVVAFFSAEHAASGDELAATIRRAAGTDRIAGCSAVGGLTSKGEAEGGHGLAVLALCAGQLQCQPLLFKPLRQHEIDIGVEIGRVSAPRETRRT